MRFTAERVAPIGTHMWRVSIIVWIAVVGGLASGSFAQDADRPIRAIGEFSNTRHTEGHDYGYTVDLWRDGDLVIGLLYVSEGLEGDAPTGMLENVKLQSRTGALSFSARLTTGITLLPDGRQEPSRDLFEFSGTLKAATLTGTLQRSDPRQPAGRRSRDRVALRIRPQGGFLLAGT